MSDRRGPSVTPNYLKGAGGNIVGDDWKANQEESALGGNGSEIDWNDFLGSPLGGDHGPGWKGHGVLGEGATGIAGLWQKRNSDGKIIDRMVVKQLKGDEWMNGNIPDEVKTLHILKQFDSPFIIRLRGYRRYNAQKMHRIYLEFAPYGDLDLLTFALSRSRRKRNKTRYLPEPFLWLIFRALAVACGCLQEGEPNRSAGHVPYEWVHADIKTGNVFLGDGGKYMASHVNETNSVLSSSYPTAKMSDFSHSGKVPPVEAYRTMAETKLGRACGTKHWQAPEQLRVSGRVPYASKDYKCASWTNVWGIGSIMFTLMTQPYKGHPPEFYSDSKWLMKQHTVKFPIRTARDPEYSKELRETVLQCLRINPRLRPHPDNLTRYIKNQVNKIGKALKTLNDNVLPVPERLWYLHWQHLDRRSLVQDGGRIHRRDIQRAILLGYEDPKEDKARRSEGPYWKPISEEEHPFGV